MSILKQVFERLTSALLMAISVALLTAGLFAYAPPTGLGESLATPAASEIGGDPILGTDSPPAPSAVPSLSPHTPSPTPSIAPSAAPTGSVVPGPTFPAASPSVGPSASATPGVPATRIVIPSLRVDLAVMSGEADVRGNRDNYPLCDVAQYLTYYGHPGEVGTAYIYAHAQRGMFLPLLRASQRNDGAEMIGALVEVYTADSKLHLYEIYRVKRHARDFSLANDVPPGEHILVLQTSEGTTGHIPKLQVAARPLTVLPADPAEANPRPDPRPCWPR